MPANGLQSPSARREQTRSWIVHCLEMDQRKSSATEHTLCALLLAGSCLYVIASAAYQRQACSQAEPMARPYAPSPLRAIALAMRLTAWGSVMVVVSPAEQRLHGASAGLA